MIGPKVSIDCDKIIDWHSFHEELSRPEQYDAVIECAAFANWRWLEKGEPAVLAISFWN